MSGEGAPAYDVPDASGERLAIVAANWHRDLVDELVAGACRAAAAAGVESPTVVRVAGAVEVPVVAAALAPHHEAVVALGLVLRGETAHFDHVCRVVADGCARVALDTGTPVGMGVLMCETMAQANARVDKGAEATVAALRTALTLAEVRGRDRRPAGF